MRKCWCGRTMRLHSVRGISNTAWWWKCPARKHGALEFIANVPNGTKPTKRQLNKKRQRLV